MAKEIRRLGRGLNSLLSSTKGKKEISTIPPAAEMGETGPAGTDTKDDVEALAGGRKGPGEGIGGGGQVLRVACSAIEANPFQPRLDPEKANLEELADSIRQVGVLQPLTVRAKGEGRFELIAGERRWRASQLAGLAHVPVIVRDINDERMLEEALIENIQREDLNAVDRALAYRRYCDSFGLTIEQVAERVGEKRQTVSNFLRLLELDTELQDLISHGVLSAGHGKALAGVTDRSLRMGLAKTVVARSLSVRALEELIRETKRPPAEQADSGPKKTAAERRAEKRAVVADLEERFSQAVGTHVEIVEGKPKGSGQIIVDFYTLDDFDRIAGILGVKLDEEM